MRFARMKEQIAIFFSLEALSFVLKKSRTSKTSKLAQGSELLLSFVPKSYKLIFHINSQKMNV